jgi:predicted ribosomally synthesized peptide with SipW-like signal peptide
MSRNREWARRSGLIRLRAALAGGLVLGVGAAVTLASWTDSESSKGSFTASVFATQSSANGTTFVANPATPGATLTFSAAGMAPGVDNYAFLDVRTTASTTVGGTVTLTSATAAGLLAPGLGYRVVRIPVSTTCAAAAFTGSPTFVAGDATTYLAVTIVPVSPVASTIAAAGGSTRLCVDLRILTTAPSSLQGTSAAVTWQFTAVSS